MRLAKAANHVKHRAENCRLMLNPPQVNGLPMPLPVACHHLGPTVVEEVHNAHVEEEDYLPLIELEKTSLELHHHSPQDWKA